MRALNFGLENAVGVNRVRPVNGQGVLGGLLTFQDSSITVERLYGTIPQGPTAPMYKVHDSTVAESVTLINQSTEYAKKQEENADVVFRQAPTASPKGAARMAAVANAQILHAIVQLVKINSQMLKIQSEAFGLENRQGKEEVQHFNFINEELKRGIIPTEYIVEDRMPRF